MKLAKNNPLRLSHFLANRRRIVGRSRSSATSSTPAQGSVFWCGQVVFPDQIQPGTVVVDESGTIVKTGPGDSLQQATKLASHHSYQLHNLSSSAGRKNVCLSPGLIDVHAHISALGRDWEGYASATKAASAGGITTIVGMPLNSVPPTTTPESFGWEREAAAKEDLYANVSLWGGLVPGNCNENDLDLLLESGVLGLKAFLSPLPPAAGFEAVSPEQLFKAAEICGKHDKPILVHSELMTEQELQQSTERSFGRFGSQSNEAHVQSRPSKWEQDAVEVVCQAASVCHMHIVHLSDAIGCLPIIQRTKDDPPKSLTVETCPHYLLFDSSMIRDGDTKMKCFPPIRDPENRRRLWEGMETGLIDMVASDHSPCEPSMRLLESGDVRNAWAGLSGLQYQLQATWTEAVKRGYTPLDMARWWSCNPSLLAKTVKKGVIRVGRNADMCWWDTESLNGCNGQEYHRWTGTTCYANNPDMCGKVLGTWIKGKQVYDGFEDQHLEPNGEFLVHR